MASKFTVGTPNTLGKAWKIDIDREYRKLSYRPVSKPWTEQRNYHRKLKTIKLVHTPAKLNNHVSLLFRRELKRIWSLLLELLQNVMKQKGEAFAKVVWIQIANLIKMVQFRCGSKFTVLPTDGKNSDQWRREDPGNREPSQLTGIRKIKRKRKIRDLKTLKVKNPKRSKHQRQHAVIKNRTLFN